MSDETSQRLKASMGGFSLITALTQRAINNAMQKLVQAHPELTDVNIESPKSGHKLEAIIGQPLVSLKVTGPSRSDLEYTVRFASGSLHLAYPNPLDFSVKDWVIVFNVALDRVNILPGEEGYEEARAAIQQPGDYSIESLFLTFNDGDIIKPDPDRCDFNGAPLDVEDIYAFGSLLALWYINEGPMKHRKNRTIGYGIRSENSSTVNNQAPQFIPTSLRFQTYEYRAPGKNEPTEGIPDGNNNMLLYLQMTNKDEFPSDALLEYTGNFALKGMGGTMCIRRDIFWDQYLLRSDSPLLQMLNQVTYAWVEYHRMDSVTKAEFTIALGDDNHRDDLSFFKWRPVGSDSLRWSFLPDEEREQHTTDDESWGSAYGRLYINCSTDNSIETRPGSNTILVSGTTTVGIRVEGGSGSGISPWGYWYTVDGKIKWDTKLTVKAVDTGIEISMDLKQDSFQVKVESHSDLAGAPGITPENVEEKRDKVEGDLKDSLAGIPFQETEENLRNDLSGAAHIVVPGQGQFTYRDPIFNNAGDLIMEIGYE